MKLNALRSVFLILNNWQKNLKRNKILLGEMRNAELLSYKGYKDIRKISNHIKITGFIT